jgi:hypothetical protein
MCSEEVKQENVSGEVEENSVGPGKKEEKFEVKLDLTKKSNFALKPYSLNI